MKIAFIGSMVNNGYIMSHALNKAGLKVSFIRGIHDLFLPHQPVWVDKKFSIPSNRLWPNSFEECLQLENRLNWKAPAWVIDSRDILRENRPLCYKTSSILRDYLRNRRISRCSLSNAIIGALQDFDYIFACGISEAILARASGKPYTIWSYGGDIRYLLNTKKETSIKKIRGYAYHRIARALLHDSYRSANYVGFNYGMKIYCSDWSNKNKKRSYKIKSPKLIPAPAFYHAGSFFPKKEDGLVKDNNKIYILIPSRVDFFVKGHDKLLAAICLLSEKERKNLHFTFVGWGNDLEVFINELRERGMHDISIIREMHSRPKLLDYINSSDLVIDQFNIGLYGTAALEAMSLGKPVMLFLNVKLSGHTEPPPVLNCSTREEIHDLLKKIAANCIDLKSDGIKLKAWAKKYHGNETFRSCVEECILL